ncbi:MAG: hypothetical protein ACK55I_08595 [bacterium]
MCRVEHRNCRGCREGCREGGSRAWCCRTAEVLGAAYDVPQLREVVRIRQEIEDAHEDA